MSFSDKRYDFMNTTNVKDIEKLFPHATDDLGYKIYKQCRTLYKTYKEQCTVSNDYASKYSSSLRDSDYESLSFNEWAHTANLDLKSVDSIGDFLTLLTELEQMKTYALGCVYKRIQFKYNCKSFSDKSNMLGHDKAIVRAYYNYLHITKLHSNVLKKYNEYKSKIEKKIEKEEDKLLSVSDLKKAMSKMTI